MKTKLQKFKCPVCQHVEPMMALINTMNCLKCQHVMVEPVKNEYFLLDTETSTFTELYEKKEK